MSNRVKQLKEKEKIRQIEEKIVTCLKNAKNHNKTIERLCSCEFDLKIKKKLSDFLDSVYYKAPKIISCEYFEGFRLLLKLEPWLNTIEEWEPKGKGKDSLFQSLVDHLLCKYSVPKFLYKIFYKRRPDINHGLVFRHLAQGGSIVGLDKTIFPAILTRRMRAEFLKLSADTIGFVEGIRTVQIKSLGGTAALLNAMLVTTIGQEFQTNEEFWISVIQWFCNNPLLDKKHIAPLIDYIRHLKAQDQNFSMKGRSPLALLRGMEEWHGTLAKIKAMNGLVFSPCGLESSSFIVKENVSGKKIENNWTITEILSSKELAEEGRALRHCVYSYAHSISIGKTAIWSLKKNGERKITIEVSTIHSSIVQSRGFSNRFPEVQERELIRRWAMNNSLIILRYS